MFGKREIACASERASQREKERERVRERERAIERETHRVRGREASTGWGEQPLGI